MPVISLANTKGGAGKTTTAIHLACQLARKSSIILIDADPNCHVMFWASLPADYDKDRGAAIISGKEQNLIPENLTVLRNYGEDKIIDEIEDAATKAAFVVVDLEGIASKRVANAISFSDLVIIPMGKDQQEARNTADTIQAVRIEAKRARQHIPYRVLFTRVKAVAEGGTQRHIEAAIRNSIPDYVFKTQIMERDTLKKIHSTGGPLQDIASGYKLRAAEDNIEALTNEVIHILRSTRDEKAVA